MVGTYAVTLNGEKVGTVMLTRRGLYYEVTCKCRAAGDQMLQLFIEGNGVTENLGLLIPAAGGLELRKRIPVKRLGDSVPAFILRSRNANTTEFIPVSPDASFPGIHRLQDCVFAVRNGQPGVAFSSKNNGEKIEI